MLGIRRHTLPLHLCSLQNPLQCLRYHSVSFTPLKNLAAWAGEWCRRNWESFRKNWSSVCITWNTIIEAKELYLEPSGIFNMLSKVMDSEKWQFFFPFFFSIFIFALKFATTGLGVSRLELHWCNYFLISWPLLCWVLFPNNPRILHKVSQCILSFPSFLLWASYLTLSETWHVSPLLLIKRNQSWILYIRLNFNGASFEIERAHNRLCPQ